MQSAPHREERTIAITIKTAGFEDLLNSGGYYLRALIIGENGSGKTPFGAQWPKPLFALCENGHMSLAMSGTAYADVASSADMQAVLDKARHESRKPDASREYQTLVIDTIDSYQKLLVQERLRITKEDGLSGWADWGWLDGKMQSLMEQLKSLPLNVVVLMHTKDVEEETDGGSKRITQRARMKGDIKESVYDNFPLIGLVESYYAAGEGEDKGNRVLRRRLRWHPDPKHPVLRDQSTKLPQFTDVNFDDGDYQQIFDAITSGVDDLPQGGQVETLRTEDEGEVPQDSTDGGPLPEPKLPAAKKQAKKAAKKAPAKKAATAKKSAKKAAAKKAEPAPEEAQPEEAQEQLPTEPEEAQAEAPKEEDPWAPPENKEEPTPEAKPEPEPEAKKPAPAEKKGGRSCGDQPQTFVGKYDPVDGCGQPIEGNGTPSSLVKFRTYLCQTCFDKHMAA